MRIKTLLLLLPMFFKNVIIHHTESALAYKHGKFVRELAPGKHLLWGSGWYIVRQDNRPQMILIPNQEIMTKDLMTVKISVLATVQLVNLKDAEASSNNIIGTLHMLGQLAIRSAVSNMTLDEMIASPTDLLPALRAELEPQCLAHGYKLVDVAIRDVILPAPLKKAQLAIALAQKEGQAALEKARFETAALRSLINAANLVKEHPELAQLRMLQVLQDSKAQIQIVPQIPL